MATKKMSIFKKGGGVNKVKATGGLRSQKQKAAAAKRRKK